MKSARPYIQRRRAEAAEATGRRILDAAARLFLAGGEPPTLDAVAREAGVTVQTLLRRHGSKEGLQRAVVSDARERVRDARWAAPVGDVAGAVVNLLDHYEAWGGTSLRLLALEAVSPVAAEAVRDGRALHRGWVEHVFGPRLGPDPAVRERRLLQLVAVTDVYVWKLLRLDLGRSRPEVEATLVDLVDHLLA